ncbi:class I SAM-dependent methyltransferase [Caballeronia sp. LZ043]|uniref:class I SAM-dependent methyltransferase n=1 Tax=Caballeronia sp. LZ043 TaxID=3038569 RepID=UPI0028599DE7|nr:class I SAM-dependent methyltransferase [Caballeronia sp. LZ043]MDR5818940.1 class I SAM-dependent methyltransferase [Caballeronia sp. LZ043]
MSAPGHESKQHFDTLYQESEDPWKIRERWYERRKRALTLAALPEEYYARAFEPGCGNGELTALLASRCGELLAADIAEQAVELTRRRISRLANVSVEQMQWPDVWPSGSVDLVVMSEIGYYLDEPQLLRVADFLHERLSASGAVVACHWRKEIAGWPRIGDDVHATLRDRLSLPHLCRYQDDDLVLDVWTRDARSVHEREGLE